MTVVSCYLGGGDGSDDGDVMCVYVSILFSTSLRLLISYIFVGVVILLRLGFSF